MNPPAHQRYSPPPYPVFIALAAALAEIRQIVSDMRAQNTSPNQ